LPDELLRLGILITGPRGLPYWQNGSDLGPLGFYDLKGVVETLFDELHLSGVSYEAASHPTFRRGRIARVLLDGEQVGLLGELDPRVVANFDIRSDYPILAADLDLQRLLKAIPDAFQVEPLPAYPAVMEDIALIVDQAVPAADVEGVIRQAGGFLLKNVELFDVYQGGSIPPGKKSLAYHLTFQSSNKTLTDKEASKNRQRIVQQLEQRYGAKLRQA
jgi:phenylalanyl-tRNA synthetase beta chain